MKKHKYLLSALFSLNVCFATSQIQVNYITADQAVNYLVGNGVEYSNPVFTGDTMQLGYLTGANGTIFPIPSGIVLSSDDVNAIEPGQFANFLANPVNGNQDLLDVANSVPPLIGQDFTVGAANDIAILEFDFVPTGDIITFTYSFGSDEYLEWVNSTFNDVFAFFVAGPGISGPYSAPAGFPDGSINIAYVPESDPQVPITISSVNNVLNSAYYIDNFANIDISSDGFTTVLTATVEVVCSETYHIKLAIADGSDNALESMVVLSEGSFLASTLVAINPQIEPIGGVAEGVLLEGCSEGSIEITPPCVFNEQTVDLTFGGTATNGTDYSVGGITQITLTPGEDVIINIDALTDAINEGMETLTITFSYTDFEGNLQTSTIEIQISDLISLDIASIDDIVLCDSPDATAVAIGGYSPYTYLWSTNATGNSIPLTELGEYDITITDACGQTANEAFEVVPPTGVALEMEDEVFICLGESVDVSVEMISGANPPTADWTGSNSSTLNANFDSNDAGYQYVTVTDACDQTAIDSILISIPTLLVGIDDLDLCVGVGTGQLAQGGTPEYIYYYDVEAFVPDQALLLVPNQAGVYTIDVADQCGQQVTIPVVVSICDTTIPNVFTPNGDGENDVFEIAGVLDFPRSKLLIYNRWGNLIEEYSSYANNWNGADCPEGVYYYIFVRSDDKQFEGYVHLLRD